MKRILAVLGLSFIAILIPDVASAATPGGACSTVVSGTYQGYNLGEYRTVTTAGEVPAPPADGTNDPLMYVVMPAGSNYDDVCLGTSRLGYTARQGDGTFLGGSNGAGDYPECGCVAVNPGDLVFAVGYPASSGYHNVPSFEGTSIYAASEAQSIPFPAAPSNNCVATVTDLGTGYHGVAHGCTQKMVSVTGQQGGILIFSSQDVANELMGSSTADNPIQCAGHYDCVIPNSFSGNDPGWNFSSPSVAEFGGEAPPYVAPSSGPSDPNQDFVNLSLVAFTDYAVPAVMGVVVAVFLWRVIARVATRTVSRV